MTQQYLLGHLSLLLEDLERTAVDWGPAVRSVRRDVELASPPMLPALADEVLELTDAICWTALNRGDVIRFCGCATKAAMIGEFIDSAGLADQ